MRICAHEDATRVAAVEIPSESTIYVAISETSLSCPVRKDISEAKGGPLTEQSVDDPL